MSKVWCLVRSELGHRISPMLSCSHKEVSTNWSSVQLNRVSFCICTGGDPVLNSLPVAKETADAKNFSRLRYFFFLFHASLLPKSTSNIYGKPTMPFFFQHWPVQSIFCGMLLHHCKFLPSIHGGRFTPAQGSLPIMERELVFNLFNIKDVIL